MPTIDQKQREERYSTSSERTRNIYAGTETSKIFSKILTEQSIPRDKYNDFLDVGGDIILGFYRLSDIPKLLSEKIKLDQNKITALSDALHKALIELGIEETSISSDKATSTESKSVNQPERKVLIPSYQKPLMGVPRYQNASAVSPTTPHTPTTPPQIPPISTPPSQPPTPPRM